MRINYSKNQIKNRKINMKTKRKSSNNFKKIMKKKIKVASFLVTMI